MSEEGSEYEDEQGPNLGVIITLNHKILYFKERI